MGLLPAIISIQMKKNISLLFFLFLNDIAWCQLWKEFDVIKGSFKGTTSEQSKILLKLVKPCGNIGKKISKLSPTLDSILLSNNRLSSEKLRAYLAKNNIDEKDVGGSPSEPISKNSRGISANYFVIHDTSIELPTKDFPSTINNLSWSFNQITDGVPQKVYRYDNGNPKPHIFVNRLGISKTQVNFKTACRATK